jgi:hypothetical protein
MDSFTLRRIWHHLKLIWCQFWCTRCTLSASIGFFYMPVENGTYYGMAMSVRFSVRHTHDNDSFHSFSKWSVDGFKWYLVHRCIMKRCRSSSNMGATQVLLNELLSLDLENVSKMSFRTFSHWWSDRFKWYLVYICIMKRCYSSSNMGAARLLLEKLFLVFQQFLEASFYTHKQVLHRRCYATSYHHQLIILESFI